jgi:transposase-like protein
LTIFDIACRSDEETHRHAAQLRWGSPNKQRCPDANCGSFDSHYWRPRREQWRCRKCGRDFSVTSNTVFAYSKLSLKEVFTSAYLYCATAAGISTIENAAQIGVTPKTNWFLQHKFREATARERARDVTPFSGVVHVDGGYFGGKRREPNEHGKYHKFDEREATVRAKLEGAPSGRQRRWRNLQPGGKKNAERKLRCRVVISLRELHAQKGMGARRTRVKVVKSEFGADAMAFIEANIEPGTVVMTDDAPAYVKLSGRFTHRTVCHKERWVTDDGVSCSQSESFNSRMRRSEYGVHHNYTELHLQRYAEEKAWREDSRRMSLADKTFELIRFCLADGKSKELRGYYQGNRPAAAAAKAEKAKKQKS